MKFGIVEGCLVNCESVKMDWIAKTFTLFNWTSVVVLHITRDYVAWP